MTTEEENTTVQKRKSLAVDEKTYDLLNQICFKERRSKIDQLKILIEGSHQEHFGESA
tara:strand:- start:302 stop:475 length:174 start_codon:yes stop_codon:yes gene_type:complete